MNLGKTTQTVLRHKPVLEVYKSKKNVAEDGWFSSIQLVQLLIKILITLKCLNKDPKCFHLNEN